MPKIFKKTIYACGHCPSFNSELIRDFRANHVRNICTQRNLIIKDSSIIQKWCPLPDAREESQ